MVTGNKKYENLDDLPSSIPIFPLSGALLLPGGQMPLNIFEPRYLAMIDAALAGDRIVGMVQPAFSQSLDNRDGLCRIGCAGRLVSFSETGDNRYLISLIGISRFAIAHELPVATPFRQVTVDWRPFLADLDKDESYREIDRAALLKTFQSYLDAHGMEADWNSIKGTKTEILVNALSMMSPYGAAEKQALLEAANLKTRADTLVAITEMSLARESGGGDIVLQ